MMKAAIYCRLSEEDRNKRAGDDSGSITNQKNMLRQYAEEQHWQIYDIYSDDDYAGADRNRPEFKRLLRDAEDGRFDVVLCKTQSRFTREVELVEKYIHGLFPLWGVRFVSVVDQADTSSKANKKTRQINALINEWYLEDMSENIRSVLDNRRQNGWHIGAFALYGYQKDAEHKGRLLVDGDAAQVVREIFAKYDQGFRMSDIARHLNEAGIPNPSEYKRRKGMQYKASQGAMGEKWRRETIGEMLRNPMYIGHMVQGRNGSVSYKTKECRPRDKSLWFVVENTHEAIIGRTLWDAVQERLQRGQKRAPGQKGPLAGKVFCSSCGSGLQRHQSRGRWYLQCPAHSRNKEHCPGAFIAEERLAEMAGEGRDIRRIEVGRRIPGSRDVPVTIRRQDDRLPK